MGGTVHADQLTCCSDCVATDIPMPCFGPSRDLCKKAEKHRHHIRQMTLAGGWSEPDHALAKIIGNVCGVRVSPCSCVDKPALCHRVGLPILVSVEHCRRCPSIAEANS